MSTSHDQPSVQVPPVVVVPASQIPRDWPSVITPDVLTDEEDIARRNAALIELLNRWSVEDVEEQQETWEFLRVALDEDRLSDRKLFP